MFIRQRYLFGFLKIDEIRKLGRGAVGFRPWRNFAIPAVLGYSSAIRLQGGADASSPCLSIVPDPAQALGVKPIKLETHWLAIIPCLELLAEAVGIDPPSAAVFGLDERRCFIANVYGLK